MDAEALLSLDLAAIRLPQGDEESERTVQHFLYAIHASSLNQLKL